MRNDEFEEYLWDTIHDVLMRVISDLESLQYDLSVMERLRDEPKRIIESEEKRMSAISDDRSYLSWDDFCSKDSIGGK